MWPTESDTVELTPQQVASIVADSKSGETLGDGIAGERRFVLVDCREPDEFDICRIGGSKLIPLSTFAIEATKHLPDKDLPVILYCHHGLRSSQAALYLKGKGYARAYSMAGGIEAWSLEVDSEVRRY